MRRASWWPPLREQVAQEFRYLGGVFNAYSDMPNGFSLTAAAMPLSQYEDAKAKRRARYTPNIACDVCGCRLVPRPFGQGRQAIYCGKACRWKAWRIAESARAAGVIRPCQHCGAPLGPPTQRRYCNRKCKTAGGKS